MSESEPIRPIRAKPPAEEGPDLPATPDAGASPAETFLPEGLTIALKNAPDCEGKLAVLRWFFELKAIRDAADLRPGAFCALCKDAELHLLEIGALSEDRRTVEIRLYLSARRARPASLATLVELGRKGSLHRLEAKAPKSSPQTPAVVPELAATASDLETTSKTASESAIYGGQQVDLTSFTRLISLAQSCGMVPNVDNIATVRDADYRAGQFLTAYYNIERMCTALQTAAQQRQQQLRREDIAYRSGRLHMSPKEWSQKQARETAKSQSVDRALSQFRKVMAGLRLQALAAQQIGGQRDPGP